MPGSVYCTTRSARQR